MRDIEPEIPKIFLLNKELFVNKLFLRDRNNKIQEKHNFCEERYYKHLREE